MFYYLGAFVIVCGLLYRYRYRVLLWTIRIMLQIIQLNQVYKNRNVRNNHLQFVTADKLSDDVIVCHYDGYIDEKEHKIKVIKSNVPLGDDNVVENILQTIEYRNHIVHCSLVNTNETEMLELTSVFREFVYHFDKDDDLSKMKHFFQYVSKYYDLDSIEGDKNDLYFVIYLNDESFTELKYKVREITNQQFKEILGFK